MGIVKRPAARARGRIYAPPPGPVPSTKNDPLDARLGAIVASVKNMPPDPPRPQTLEEEIGAMPTSDLLHVLFTLDARERTDVRGADEIERLRVVRDQIDFRIPKRRA